MKVLAMLTLKPEAKLEKARAELANELKASWALYASGALREVYATEDPKRFEWQCRAGGQERTPRARFGLSAAPSARGLAQKIRRPKMSGRGDRI